METASTDTSGDFFYPWHHLLSLYGGHAVFVADRAQQGITHFQDLLIASVLAA